MRRWLLLLVAVAGLLISTTVVFANHAWSNYHWARASNPFTLPLGNNLTTNEWKGYLGQVSSDWSLSEVLDTSITAGQGGTSCKARDGRIEVCNSWYGYNGWLGLAQIWVSGSHIVKGVAKVNDAYLSHPYYNYPEVKRHVLCQEVGHPLGLGHSAGVSCMNDGDGLWDPAYVSPDAHDYEQLAIIYAHLDAVTDGGGKPGKGNGRGNGNGADASEFGRLVSTSPSGRSSTFEKQEGGYRVLTVVLWADPGLPGAR